MPTDDRASEGKWQALISIACIVALPLFPPAIVARAVSFRLDLAIMGALLMCGWMPLAVLLFAAGYRRAAAMLTLLGDLWSILMMYVVVLGGMARPSTGSLLRELAEYVIVGGGIGALAGTVFAVWRWRTVRCRWLMAGIAAAALAGISCSPTFMAAGLRLSSGR